MISRRAQVDVAHAKLDVNQTYCQKEGDYFERGEIVHQGQRNGLVNMKDDALHMTAEELLEQYGERWIRYRRSIREHLIDEASDHPLRTMQETFTPDDVRLRLWQRTCLQMLDRQMDRKILFVVDPEGNNRMTWLAKYIRANQDAMYLTIKSMADVLYAYGTQAVVMFDLTRQLQEVISYGTLESLKNGMAFSRKYECRERIFEPTKVVVFTNQPPNMTALTADRYTILDL